MCESEAVSAALVTVIFAKEYGITADGELEGGLGPVASGIFNRKVVKMAHFWTLLPSSCSQGYEKGP